MKFLSILMLFFGLYSAHAEVLDIAFNAIEPEECKGVPPLDLSKPLSGCFISKNSLHKTNDVIQGHIETVGPLAKLSLDAAEHLMADMIRAKVVKAQVSHLKFRDEIDLKNRGSKASFLNDGRLDTMLSASYPNIKKYPEALKVFDEGIRLFQADTPDEVKMQKQIIDTENRKFILGGTLAKKKCQGLSCLSLPQRAAIIQKSEKELSRLKKVLSDTNGNERIKVESEISKNEQAITQIMTDDPALLVKVSSDPVNFPNACKEPKASKAICRPLYVLAAAHNGEFEENYNVSQNNPGDPFFKGLYQKRFDDLNNLYAVANSQMKGDIIRSLQKVDELSMNQLVMAKSIAQSVIKENPELAPLYCRMLKKALIEKGALKVGAEAAKVAGVAAAGVGLVASFVSGGASAALGASMASGLYFTAGRFAEYYSVSEDLEREQHSVAAREGDPRLIVVAIDRKKELVKEFEQDLVISAVSAGLAPTLKVSFGVIKKLKAAGKINAIEESYLILRAEKMYGQGYGKGVRLAGSSTNASDGVRFSRMGDAFEEFPNSLFTKEALSKASASMHSGLAQKVDLVPVDATKYATHFDQHLPDLYSDLKGTVKAFEVTGKKLPTGTNASPMVNALEHPEMAAYIEKMHKANAKLIMDPTLPLSKNGIGGYFDPKTNTIFMNPNANFHTFLHEFEHLDFHKKMGKVMDGAETFVEFSQKQSKAAIKQFEQADPVLARAIKLSKSGLPDLAVDETIAVDVQIKALKKAGYGLLSPERIKARSYALDISIKELQEIGQLTDTQWKTLKKIRVEKWLLENPGKTKAIGASAGIIATGATAGAGAASIYYREDIGNFFIQYEDGSFSDVSVEDVSTSVN